APPPAGPRATIPPDPRDPAARARAPPGGGAVRRGAQRGAAPEPGAKRSGPPGLLAALRTVFLRRLGAARDGGGREPGVGDRHDPAPGWDVESRRSIPRAAARPAARRAAERHACDAAPVDGWRARPDLR